MPIDLILDSLDSVDEQTKALYKETDGKHHLDPDAYAARQKQPLAEKNRQLLTEVKEARAKLEKFKSFDDEKLAAFQEWDQKQGDGDDDTGKQKDGKPDDQSRRLQEKAEQRERKLRETHKAELEAATAKVQDAEKRLQGFVRDTTLKDIALKAGVLPDMLDVFLSYFGNRFKLNEHNELVALDEDGDALEIKPQKFVTETCKELKPRFFAAPEQGGSGANGAGTAGSKGQKTMKRAAFDQMGVVQKAEFIRAKGNLVD